MYDRRVVRGNTYAAMIIPNVEQQPRIIQQTKKRQREDNYQGMKREGTPEPVEGRKHISVDCIRGDDAILKPLEL